MTKTLQVALVHDWLVSYRGGEKVLECIAKMYPDAPIYTLFYKPEAMPDFFKQRTVKVNKAINLLSPIRKLLLPWMPSMIEALPLESYDLIISTSSCVAKGAIPGPQGKHLCYIHSPMRYVWDQRAEYFHGLKILPGAALAIHLASKALRQWDVVSSQRVDRFVANSTFVAQRVRRYYGHTASVIHPPIDLERFCPLEPGQEKQDYFLAAGAFVSYKRFDLAIEACEALGKKLIVAGSGPMEKSLRRLNGRYTKFEIAPSSSRWVELLQNAQALIFPGVEDFGMVPVEALACGTPIIAFEKGGALDYVVPKRTGLFFGEQHVDSLVKVLSTFDPLQFSAEDLSVFAQTFSADRFVKAMKDEINLLLEA
jgi:glycosyltransferase involved in cell wall biosynthesis